MCSLSTNHKAMVRLRAEWEDAIRNCRRLMASIQTISLPSVQC